MIETILLTPRIIAPGATLKELSPLIRIIEHQTGLKACRVSDFKYIVLIINRLIKQN